MAIAFGMHCRTHGQTVRRRQFEHARRELSDRVGPAGLPSSSLLRSRSTGISARSFSTDRLFSDGIRATVPLTVLAILNLCCSDCRKLITVAGNSDFHDFPACDPGHLQGVLGLGPAVLRGTVADLGGLRRASDRVCISPDSERAERCRVVAVEVGLPVFLRTPPGPLGGGLWFSRREL